MGSFSGWRTAFPDVPLECLVNAALLEAGTREVVQFDLSYHPPEARDAVDAFLRVWGTAVQHRTDARGNVVVYLTRHAPRIEATLKNAPLGTVAFACLLDPSFYVSAATVEEVVGDDGPAVRVSIDVLDPRDGRCGALVVQMLTPDACDDDGVRRRLHTRFRTLSCAVEDVDPCLQTTLAFYTRPGPWKGSPELAPAAMRTLPPASVLSGKMS